MIHDVIADDQVSFFIDIHRKDGDTKVFVNDGVVGFVAHVRGDHVDDDHEAIAIPWRRVDSSF